VPIIATAATTVLLLVILLVARQATAETVPRTLLDAAQAVWRR
jgi:hypothetical protein